MQVEITGTKWIMDNHSINSSRRVRMQPRLKISSNPLLPLTSRYHNTRGPSVISKTVQIKVKRSSSSKLSRRIMRSNAYRQFLGSRTRDPSLMLIWSPIPIPCLRKSKIWYRNQMKKSSNKYLLSVFNPPTSPLISLFRNRTRMPWGVRMKAYMTHNPWVPRPMVFHQCKKLSSS
jgi:hypothetical protein